MSKLTHNRTAPMLQRLRLASIILSLSFLAAASALPALADNATPAESNLTLPDVSTGVSTSSSGSQGTSTGGPRLELPLPTFKFSDIQVTDSEFGLTTTISIPWIAQYVSGLYKYMIAIAGVIASLVLVIGGFLWLTSGGDAARIEAAKKRISDAVIGLSLILGTYLILNAVNPDLITFKALDIIGVKRKTIEVSTGIDFGAPDPPTNSGPVPSNLPAVKATGANMGSDGVPWFMQCDPKFNPKDLSWMPAGIKGTRTDCTSICQRGCGSTSLAMVLNYYGANTDPTQTAAWGLGCKGAWQPSTLKSISSKYPGFKGEGIYGKNRMDKLISYVTSGKPIIYNCSPCIGYDIKNQESRYGGHYVVLTGYDAASKTFRVNDPGRNANRRIRNMTYDAVSSNWVVAVYVHK